MTVSSVSAFASVTSRAAEKRQAFSTLLLLLLACVVPLCAQAASGPMPAADAKWRHFVSPHFELYSRNGESESRELLHNFEILRAVFLERMNTQERLHVPVTVYSFRDKDDFMAYTPAAFRKREHLAGFHLFMPDRAIISIAPAENSEEAQETVFHEYVHHLFRIAEMDPPLWFNEGTADVLAGMQVERKHVLIGTPLVNRAQYLRQETLLPLEQLFAADQASRAYTDEDKAGVFYAESWALMHYWHFGDNGLPKGAVERFLQIAGNRDAAAATDLRRHFQACFGCDYPQMLRRLRDYVRSGSYVAGKHPLPNTEPASSYAQRAVTPEEITVRLAELAVRVDHSPSARLLLLNAVGTRRADPRPLETLGVEALFEDDHRAATERWEQALAAGSDNPAIIRELALMEGRAWFEHFDPAFRLQDEAAARMRARLLRSIALEPLQGAAYELLAWVEGFAEMPDAKNINRVITQLPAMADKKRTLVGLTQVMLRVGKADVAALMLRRLAEMRLQGPDAAAAASLRRQLDSEYPQASAVTPSGPSDAASIAPPPSVPGLATPSVGLPDDL